MTDTPLNPEQVAEAMRLQKAGHMMSEISRRLGCRATQVAHAIEAIRTAKRPTKQMPPEFFAALATSTEAQLTARFHVSASTIQRHRKRLGIRASKSPHARKWTSADLELLGTYTDARVARLLGIKLAAVAHKRRMLGRPVVNSLELRKIQWTPEMLDALGKKSDRQCADLFGLFFTTVAKKRRDLGIPAWRAPDFEWTQEAVANLYVLTARQFHQKYDVSWNELRAKRAELQVPGKPTGHFSTVKFSSQMIGLLGKRPDRRLARNFKLDVNIVTRKRRSLGIKAFRLSQQPWTQEFLDLLGKIPDPQLAEKMGVNVTSVAKKRWKLGIDPCVQYFNWTKPRLALLGTMPDDELAQKYGLSIRLVEKKRNEFRIPIFGKARMKWTPEMLAWLATMSDAEVAEKLGVNVIAVRSRRKRMAAQG